MTTQYHHPHHQPPPPNHTGTLLALYKYKTVLIYQTQHNLKHQAQSIKPKLPNLTYQTNQPQPKSAKNEKNAKKCKNALGQFASKSDCK